jgi:hypothetical protein
MVDSFIFFTNMTGCGAQEENLHRRSNLFQYLDDPDDVARSTRGWGYPIPDFGGIYSSKCDHYYNSDSFQIM